MRLRDIRKLVSDTVLIEDDREAGVLRATAPHGYRWARADVHEIVTPYEERVWYQEALVALAQDLQGDYLELCTDRDCDWCHSDNNQEIGNA